MDPVTPAQALWLSRMYLLAEHRVKSLSTTLSELAGDVLSPDQIKVLRENLFDHMLPSMTNPGILALGLNLQVSNDEIALGFLDLRPYVLFDDQGNVHFPDCQQLLPALPEMISQLVITGLDPENPVDLSQENYKVYYRECLEDITEILENPTAFSVDPTLDQHDNRTLN